MTPTTPKREINLRFDVRTTNRQTITTTVKGPVIKVGRDVNCHLRIEEDAAVARMHTVIEATMVNDVPEVVVIDLGSVTYLKTNTGGWNAVNKCKIAVGDTFRVGDTTLTLTGIMVLELPVTPTATKEPTTPVPPPRPTTTSVPPPVNRRVAPRPFSLRSLAVRAIAGLVRAARTIEAEDRNTRR